MYLLGNLLFAVAKVLDFILTAYMILIILLCGFFTLLPNRFYPLSGADFL